MQKEEELSSSIRQQAIKLGGKKLYYNRARMLSHNLFSQEVHALPFSKSH